MSDIEQALDIGAAIAIGKRNKPKKTYPIREDARQKAQNNARGVIHGKRKKYAQRAQHCKCGTPWNGGEGRCLTCGKWL